MIKRGNHNFPKYFATLSLCFISPSLEKFIKNVNDDFFVGVYIAWLTFTIYRST